MMVSEIIVAALLLLLIYSWVLYPLAVLVLGRGTAGGESMPDDAALPQVMVFLSAHNEEVHIEERLKNILALDYPAGNVTVWIGVDGSTDRTAAIARGLAQRHTNIRIKEYLERQGKIATIKRLVAEACAGDRRIAGEQRALPGFAPLLVFTDANTFFRPDAVNRLAARFADLRVGGVCGRLILKDKAGGPATPEGLYWRLESELKLAESRLDSCLGANGAIYAVRKELFPAELPDNTIVDDFVVGMKVRESGSRFVYEPLAVAEELLPEAQHEWGRRVRIGAGDFQAMALCARCLGARYGRFAAMFWSHKILRWLTPLMGIVAVVLSAVNVAVAGAAAFSACGAVAHAADLVVLATAATLLLLAAAGRLLRLAGIQRGIPAACDHFLTMQLALFVGFLKFCGGGVRGHWSRTPR